jgi:hypothetical protein
MHIPSRKLLATGALGVSLVLGTLTTAQAAYAGTGAGCLGNTCSGLDSTQSFNQNTKAECSSGASDSADLPNGTNVLGGLLELRWGPNCQTNWARFTPGNSDTYYLEVENNSRVWAGTGLYHLDIFSGKKGISQYSDQVYSPGPAATCIYDYTTGGNYCYEQSGY